MLKELKFSGEIKKQRCSICKLQLSKNDEILSCPQCNSLFHKKHLVEWLKEMPECPVCEKDFTDLVVKYNEELSIVGHGENLTKQRNLGVYVLNNRYPVEEGIFSRIFLTIFGIFFALAPNLTTSLTMPWKDALYVNLFTWIFGLAGMSIVYFGNIKLNKNIINSWDEMIFSTEKVLITSDEVDNLEIRGEDITEIELHRTYDTPGESSTRKRYLLKLRICTIKNKCYDFGDIRKSRNADVISGTYLPLRNTIKQYYGIITKEIKNEFFTFISRGFRKNWLFFLIAILLHLAISAICILIKYYVL